MRLALTRSRGTLAQLFKGHRNGVGLLRLLLALAVVLSHSRPLGFGQHDVGYHLFRAQTNVGTMAVYGFFVLSGLLITRSASRVPLGRYLWHRALRILPGLWVCLLVTAVAVGPLVMLHEHGTTTGYWTRPFAPGGPLSYLTANWWTGVRQYGIRDLLAGTPWGRIAHGSVFDGALWSLVYEMGCYIAFGIFAITAILTRARRFILFLAGMTYLYILRDYAHTPGLASPINSTGRAISLPLVGSLSLHWIIYLGFLFLIGASFELYRDRLPIHDGLGLASGLLLILSLVIGGFFVIGMVAYAYFLVWLAIRMPAQLHWVGRRHDYSYGIYIYGFVGQQVLVSFGANRWGFIPYVALSTVVAVAAGVASWHLVEQHALRLKGWSPRVPVRRWAGVLGWQPALATATELAGANDAGVSARETGGQAGRSSSLREAAGHAGPAAATRVEADRPATDPVRTSG